MASDMMDKLITLLNAVGHVGTDFGHGPYALSHEEIQTAQELYSELRSIEDPDPSGGLRVRKAAYHISRLAEESRVPAQQINEELTWLCYDRYTASQIKELLG